MAANTPTMETETALGARTGGTWQAGAPNVALFPVGTAGDPDRGTLAVVVEMAGPDIGRAETGRAMIQAIQRAYFSGSGTVTMGLRRAIEVANEMLYQTNATTIREQRRHAGVGVAALVGADLYLGQAGPSLIYVVQAGELLQFPTDSPWLSNGEEDEEGGWYPIGVRRKIQVDLYHVEVGDDDVVVVTTPAVAQLANGDFLVALLDQPAQDVVNDLAQIASSSASNPDLAVVAMRLAGTGVETAPAPPEIPEEYARPEDADEEEPVRTNRLGDMAQSSGEVLRQAGEQSRRALGSVGSAAGTLIKRTLPDRPDGASPLPSRIQWWKILAVLVPLIVLGVVIGMTLRSAADRRAQDERVASLLSQAQERLTVATSSQSDKQSQTNLLNFAEGMVAEALRIRPNNEQGRKLQGEIQTLKEQVTGTYRLADMTSLASIADTGAIVQNVWVSGPQAFVLDTGLGRVLRVRLGSGPANFEPLLRTGETVGNRTVGDLADMVWLRAGGTRTLEDVAALARDGVLWQVSATGTRTGLAVAGSRDWQNPLIADTYGGNFYLLQAEKSQILRYGPSANDGYAEAPTPWMAGQVDIKGAVDMAIDGQIYLLMSDGRVRRFTAGREDKFELKGFDKPLSSPRALFTTPDTKSLYVLEAGRVVEISKEGDYVRQFQPKEGENLLDDPRGLFVDEKGGKLFVVNGKSLYDATLPPVRANKP